MKELLEAIKHNLKEQIVTEVSPNYYYISKLSLHYQWFVPVRQWRDFENLRNMKWTKNAYQTYDLAHAEPAHSAHEEI